MGGFSNTILGLLDAYPDPREEVSIPLMTKIAQQRFVKMAVEHIPGAQKPFNEVYGGTYTASAFPPVKLLDTGLPPFLWTK